MWLMILQSDPLFSSFFLLFPSSNMFLQTLLSQQNLHFIFFHPPSSTPCVFHYGQLYFPSQSACVCAWCVRTCTSPHISAETQSIHRGQSSQADFSEHSTPIFLFFICFNVSSASFVTKPLRNIFFDWDLSYFQYKVNLWPQLETNTAQLVLRHHVLCEKEYRVRILWNS